DREAGRTVGQGVCSSAHVIDVGVVGGQRAGGDLHHVREDTVVIIVSGDVLQDEAINFAAAVQSVIEDHILVQGNTGQTAGEDPGSGAFIYVQNFHSIGQRGRTNFGAFAVHLAGQAGGREAFEGY